MDSFEWNKVAAAVLAAALVFLGLKELGHKLYHPHAPKEFAYEIELPEGPDSGAAEEEEAAPDLTALLSTASASAGERVSKKCISCHSLDKGGANGTGPNLWDVIGRQAGALGGFNYSAALQEFGEPWTYEHLFGFLEKPTAYVPGTNMNFAGLRKPEDRANLIAYMRTLSDAPAALPEAAPEAAPEEAEAEEAEVEEAPVEEPETESEPSH